MCQFNFTVSYTPWYLEMNDTLPDQTFPFQILLRISQAKLVPTEINLTFKSATGKASAQSFLYQLKRTQTHAKCLFFFTAMLTLAYSTCLLCVLWRTSAVVVRGHGILVLLVFL